MLSSLFRFIYRIFCGENIQTETQKNWNKHFNNETRTNRIYKAILVPTVCFILLFLGVYYADNIKDIILLSVGAKTKSISNNATDMKTNNNLSPHNFIVTSSKDIKTKFSDIHGLEQAKNSLNDFIIAIKKPEIFSKLGARPPHAILLHGPSGNGKTMLARALAGEAQVNIIATTGTNFIQKYVGLGAARVREIFAAARQNQPCIIFIDEFEVLVPKRQGLEFSSGSEYHSTVNQLLSELDGFDEKKNAGVYFVAATNFIKNIDEAVLRAGRFHSKILIGYPSYEEKIAILNLYLSKVVFDPKLDKQRVYQLLKTKFSRADISALVNEATLNAARTDSKHVTNSHFEEAYKQLKPVHFNLTFPR